MMKGIKDLKTLLASMKPELSDNSYVFCTVDGELNDYLSLKPLATFVESEGLTLVLEQSQADRSGIKYDGVYRCITLTVHSSLEAVGLTAAVSTQLATFGISANVVAAYYHDHIFVQQSKAQEAMKALAEI